MSVCTVADLVKGALESAWYADPSYFKVENIHATNFLPKLLYVLKGF